MEGFYFERCFYEVMADLSESEACELVKAMCDYKFRRQRPKIATDRLKVMWPLVKHILDQDYEDEGGDE